MKTRAWGALAAVAVLLLGLTASASADIPDSQTDEVTFCYGDLLDLLGTGLLAQDNVRVIDAEAGDSCAGNESQITMNQKGLKGDTGDTGPQGPKGDTGDTGPQGPAGADGADGVSGYEVVTDNSSLVIAPGNTGSHTLDCPTGKMPLSGGYQASVLVNVSSSYPNGNGWTFRMRNGDSNTQTPILHVTCASV